MERSKGNWLEMHYGNGYNFTIQRYKMKNTLLIILILIVGILAARRKATNGKADEICYCFEYYNKSAAHNKRVVQTTCDPSIFQFSDRLEIFKVVVHCDSLNHLNITK